MSELTLLSVVKQAYRFLRRPNRQGVQNSRFPRANSEFHCHSGLVFEVSVDEKSAGKERKKEMQFRLQIDICMYELM